MNRIIEKSNRKKREVKSIPKRYIYDKIDWNERLVLLLGHRGAGKTTLLLQHLKSSKKKSIYFSLDDLYFEENRLVYFIDKLYKKGYKRFYIDEVHRYNYWSTDLKQIYDDYSDIKLVVTGSSILDISKKGNADLSRRAAIYNLSGLSFREYLLFEKKLQLPPVNLEEVLENHAEVATKYMDEFSWEKDFKNYLKIGYYPFYLDGKENYFSKLQKSIDIVVDSDIAPYEYLHYSTVRTLKKLLFIISQTAPFKPNISKLSERLKAPRSTVLRMLDLLQQAKIVNLLRAHTKGVSYLSKPEKIYLENTNLMHVYSDAIPNIGNKRETFFCNQLGNIHEITSSKFGDFMVDNKFTFEIGGPSKSGKQIRGIPNAYLAVDIKAGENNRIPLWLFGMLY